MKSWVILFAAGMVIGIAGITIVMDPSLLRVVVAILVIGALAVTSFAKPELAIMLTMCFLPLMGLLRRSFIPLAGWTSWDPALVVAPIVCLILAHRLFVMKKRPLAKDRVSKLLLVVFLLAILESLNPEGGGLGVGLTGLLFFPAPLAWFFIGRDFGNRRLLNAVLGATLVLGIGSAVYGLWQTTVGFPSWDSAWININLNAGYTALCVLNTGYAAVSDLGAVRAFGTFSSSAEYATYVGVAFVVAFVALLHRRWLAAAALPILGLALFLDSSRGVVVLVVLAIAVLIGVRTGSLGLTALSVLSLVLAVGAVIQLFGSQLTDMALDSESPFIRHQLAGLLNPLDDTQSTYSAHQQIAYGGIVNSFHHPLGQGIAAINPRAGIVNIGSAGTEADVSNVFVGLGPIGGGLYLLLILITFWRTGKLAVSNRDATAQAALGLLIVTFGQWGNGGYYAVAPLLWLVVGWVNGPALQQATSTAERRMRVPSEVAGSSAIQGKRASFAAATPMV